MLLISVEISTLLLNGTKFGIYASHKKLGMNNNEIRFLKASVILILNFEDFIRYNSKKYQNPMVKVSNVPKKLKNLDVFLTNKTTSDTFDCSHTIKQKLMLFNKNHLSSH